VKSAEGEDLGKSKVAAQQALMKASASRFVYTAPIFVTPIILNSVLSAVKMLPAAGSKLRILSEVVGISCGLYIAMPVNCALFPQYATIPVSSLEPEI
jgi:hypothetical protein